MENRFFESRNWSPIAVGKNFKKKGVCIVERPPDTSDRSLGQLMKVIKEGDVVMGEDYSKKALVYSSSDFMYYIVRCEEW